MFVGVLFESFEIVTEHLHETARDFGEFTFVAPGPDRIENMRLDARRLRRHREAEVRIGAEVRAVQGAVERPRGTINAEGCVES